MKTKTKPETPAPKTVSTPTAVENNPTLEPLELLEARFEESYKATGAIWAQIRVQKLYAPAFDSFAKYTTKRWRSATKVLWKSVYAEAMKGATPEPKPAKAPKAPKVQPDPDPSPNHLPKGKTLVEVFAAEIKPDAPAKPARAAAQVAAKKESLGQLQNRARLAKGETRLKLVAQIIREHGPRAAAVFAPGKATALPAVGVIA